MELDNCTANDWRPTIKVSQQTSQNTENRDLTLSPPSLATWLALEDWLFGLDGIIVKLDSGRTPII